MNALPKINRRSFVVGAASAGSGLALGVALPWNVSQAATSEGSPEVNAWVVIKPDESVVIRNEPTLKIGVTFSATTAHIPAFSSNSLFAK